jgi:hypothetical protein
MFLAERVVSRSQNRLANINNTALIEKAAKLKQLG